MYPSLEHMPGPSPEAKALQLKQRQALDAYYEAWGDAPADECNRRQDTPRTLAARAVYDETVEALTKLLGPEAHCSRVDCELFDTFSDCHKDYVGFRPRHHVTREEVLAYFERLKQTNEADGEWVAP